MILAAPCELNAVNGQTPPDDAAAVGKAVHVGDLVDVDVIGSLEYDWRGGLTPEGFLDGFDRAGEQIFALCRTEAEIAEAVRTEYAKFLRDPQVIVRVLDRSGRREAVLTGAVRTPHRFAVRREVRLAELIVLARGITDAAGGEITVFRPAGSTCEAVSSGDAGVSFRPAPEPRTLRLRIADLLAGDPSANPFVFAGDTVTVVPAWPVYMIGGVGSPQRLPLRSELTLSRAVAAAGGVAKDGTPEDVTIFRRKAGRTEAIDADLSAIEAGRAEDITLLAFDIVEVGQKGRAKRQFPPVIEVEDAGSGQLPLRIVD